MSAARRTGAIALFCLTIGVALPAVCGDASMMLMRVHSGRSCGVTITQFLPLSRVM